MNKLRIAAIVTLLSLNGLAAQSPRAIGLRPDGSAVTALAEPGTKVLVLFFVASDCPVSNRTFPEMERVRKVFPYRGVAFWFVYANVDERGPAVAAHQHAFDGEGEAILDTHGELARLTQAHVTPEVSVLTRNASHSWTPAYTGRIDDRYVSFGEERPTATQHFAERAIGEALRGVPVHPATGRPVGCGIMGPVS